MAKPTPVRALAAVDAPPPPVAPDVEDVEILVGDARWTVRVMGRSGGALPSDTPLLLLGFWASEESSGGHTREALVVGRALSEMTPASLERAFHASNPRPPPVDPVQEPKGRGRRGRGRRGRRRGS